jgi:predicted porin
MKKSLLALAALTAFAGVASAQSSVTLFGIVDLSVNSVKNGSLSQKLLSSNQLNSNRLGFRGVEDLGGGMRAGFWLEGAMNNGYRWWPKLAAPFDRQPDGRFW